MEPRAGEKHRSTVRAYAGLGCLVDGGMGKVRTRTDYGADNGAGNSDDSCGRPVPDEGTTSSQRSADQGPSSESDCHADQGATSPVPELDGFDLGPRIDIRGLAIAGHTRKRVLSGALEDAIGAVAPATDVKADPGRKRLYSGPAGSLDDTLSLCDREGYRHNEKGNQGKNFSHGGSV